MYHQGQKLGRNPNQGVVGVNLLNKSGKMAGANMFGTGITSVSRITCNICKVDRPIGEYSNRQIGIYQSSIYNPNIPGGRSKNDKATCKHCTAKQVESLKCYDCRKTKPLESFNKTQRNLSKRARCIGCVQKNMDTARGADNPDSGDYVEDGSSDDDSDVDVDVDVNDHVHARKKAGTVGNKASHGENTDGDSDEDVDAASNSNLSNALASLAVSTGQPIMANTPRLPSVKNPLVPRRTTAVVNSSINSSCGNSGTSTPLNSNDKLWVTPRVKSKSKAPQNNRLGPDNHVNNKNMKNGKASSSDGDDFDVDVDAPHKSPQQPASQKFTPAIASPMTPSSPWNVVPVAAKPGSAFTWAAMAAATATPSGGSSAATPATTYSTRGTPGTPSSAVTPISRATPTASTPGTANNSRKFAKPEKLKPGEGCEWTSATAERNGWSGYGGQPSMVKKPVKSARRRRDESDDDDDSGDDF